MSSLNIWIILMILGGMQNPVTAQTTETAPLQDQQLSTDLKRLSAVSSELESLTGEMEELGQTIKDDTEPLASKDNDSIESLHFRYSILQNSLWDIVDRYTGDMASLEGSDEQAKAFVLSFNAALNLAYSKITLVRSFVDKPAVIQKLNQPHTQSGISGGTYDSVLKNLKSVENINNLKTAWYLFEEERNDPNSTLSAISESDPDYAQIIMQNEKLYHRTDDHIEQLLEERSAISPSTAERIKNSSVADLARKSKELLGNNLDTAREILLEKVERIKAKKKIDFVVTKEQYRHIEQLIQPGDILLTYSSGHMSNIFIPGAFKHAITYVGSPKQRRALGVPDVPRQTPESKLRKLEEDLSVTSLPSGEAADLIEAVAEGVVFNSLEKLTKDKVNRMAVLRPALLREDIARDLTTVFLLLDKNYDYQFDFKDPVSQCCTEILYRAINHLGRIRFKLTNRMGLPTLSADDIIHGFLDQTEPAFEFVLLAEHDISKAGTSAVILTGNSGLDRLQTLMNGTKK